MPTTPEFLTLFPHIVKLFFLQENFVLVFIFVQEFFDPVLA